MKKQNRKLSGRAFNYIPTGRKQSADWLKVMASGEETTTMVINGPIGQSWWDDTGTSAKEFRNELDKIPKGRKISVRINSEGGSIKDGLEIYNALKERSKDVTSFVDGYAVSIASVIPLAAHRVVSPKSSIWMIHEPWSYTQGNSEDHKRSAEMLDKHGDMLASIYADEIGKSKDEMRQAMKDETWFTGEEATEYGLADETPEDACNSTLAALSLEQFKNVPEHLRAKISSGIAASGQTPPQPSAPRAGAIPKTMNKKLVVAFLKKHNIEALETETDEQLQTKMDTVAVAAAPAAIISAAAGNVTDIAALRAELAAETRKRITAEVTKRADNKISNDKLAWWIDLAVKDEAGTLAQLDSMPVNRAGGDPIGSVIIINENPLEKIRTDHKTPAARRAAMVGCWNELFDDAIKRDQRRGHIPMNANTYSATLVTNFLIDGSLTDLQNRWAMLAAYNKDFSTDPYKPLATGQLKHVTAGATAQTNATNFESGNSTVAAISVTVSQYTVSFQVSNSDLNSGLRMQDLVTINTAQFANKVCEVATTPITAATFTATPLISAPGAFGFSDMATLWGQLKKSTIKNLIIDGEYMARIINQPSLFQMPGVDTGNAWAKFGWDVVALNTDWTAAGANIRGFACNPQAIAALSGLPLIPPNIPGGVFASQVATVPGLEISYQVNTWFSLATRTMWCSFDIMFGATAADATAGIVVASGTPS